MFGFPTVDVFLGSKSGLMQSIRMALVVWCPFMMEVEIDAEADEGGGVERESHEMYEERREELRLLRLYITLEMNSLGALPYSLLLPPYFLSRTETAIFNPKFGV